MSEPEPERPTQTLVRLTVPRATAAAWWRRFREREPCGLPWFPGAFVVTGVADPADGGELIVELCSVNG